MISGGVAMTALRRFLILLIALSPSAAVQAAEPCQYHIYKPEVMNAFFRDVFSEWGVAEIPAEFSVTGYEPSTTRRLVARGTQVIAEIVATQDPLRDEARFDLIDVEGRTLFSNKEEIRACPSSERNALCKRIAIRTARDNQVGDLPFEVVSSGVYSARHFYYGRLVGWGTFADQFSDSIDWLRTYLQRTEATREVVLPTFEERFRFALATDPSIRPYLDLFTWRLGPYDTVVLEGIVPSSWVYNRILRLSRDAGFSRFQMRAKIDTRFRRVEPLPRPYQC